jgi:putative transposase
MRYRRADVAGGTYFLTVNLAERKRGLLVDHIELVRPVKGEGGVSASCHCC